MWQHLPFSLRYFFLTIIYTVIVTLADSHFSNHSALISINSTSQLTVLLNKDPHVFIKFFNPSCSHCRAMAPAYSNLSRILYDYNRNDTTPKNRSVTCLEVDISKSANRELLNRYDITGVPTLLFFHGNSTFDEYSGARTTDAMFTFIQRSLTLFEEPGIPHLLSEMDVLNFLNLVDQRPVVFSVLHESFNKLQFYSQDTQLPFTEWFELTSSSSFIPRPMFATVADPSLLVLTAEGCRNHYNEQFKKLLIPPIAVAAPVADSFCNEVFWYYPGVKDSESLSSFVHTSIIGRGSYVKLTPENSRHIINADRPLMFVFGKSTRPSYSADYTLSTLSSIDTIRAAVSVYVCRPSFPNLEDYLQLPVEANGNHSSSERNSIVVLYYYGNMGPVIRYFIPGGEKSLSEWAATESLRFNEAMIQTTAGSVHVLNDSSWSALFNYDPRSVLLLLTRDGKGGHFDFLESVAQLLQPYAGKIVVARYDSKSGHEMTMTSSSSLSGSDPDLSEITERPALVIVSPGQDVRWYDGPWTIRDVARFARRWVGVDGDASDGVVGEDVAIALCFVLGSVLVIGGWVMSERQWLVAISTQLQRLKGNGQSGMKQQ